jgi:hypothetical protein
MQIELAKQASHSGLSSNQNDAVSGFYHLLILFAHMVTLQSPTQRRANAQVNSTREKLKRCRQQAASVPTIGVYSRFNLQLQKRRRARRTILLSR